MAKARGNTVYIDKSRGKGSHITLYYGEKFTVVRNLKDELKTGTYKAMLKQARLAYAETSSASFLAQLGIKENEL